MLATVLNTSSSNLTAGIPLREGWLAGEPLSGELPPVAGGTLRINLEAGGYRHFLLFGTPQVPQLIYALGARAPAQQTYDPETRKLQITVDAVEGARIRVGVFTPFPIRAVTSRRTGPIPYTWKQGMPLLSFEAVQATGDLFEIHFQQAAN